MKKIKVAIVSNIFNPVLPDSHGGLEVLNYYLAKKLTDLGHDVKLYASGDSEPKKILEPLVPKSLTFSRDKDFLLEPWNYRVITVEEFAAYTKFIEDFEEKDRIIHFNLVNFLPIYLAAKKKLPMITTIHMTPKNFHFNFLPTVLSQDEMKRANLVGVSEFQVEDYHWAKKVVYNGVDTSLFQFQINPKNTFAWIGRMVSEKGPEEAILATQKSKVKICLAGEAKSKNEIDYFNDNLADYASSEVEFVGCVLENQKSDFYNAKALLFTSRIDEAFGLVMTEAMACGTPIIAFDRGPVREIVKDGETGFLVKDGDIAGLVKAIDKINNLSGSEERKMRDNCRKTVEKRFSLDIMTSEYLETYQQILNEKNG